MFGFLFCCCYGRVLNKKSCMITQNIEAKEKDFWTVCKIEDIFFDASSGKHPFL